MQHHRAISLVLLLALAGGVQAQQPITVEADQLELNQTSGISIYKGNVLLQQDTMRLSAERLELHSKGGQLHEAYADGQPVKMSHRDNETGELIRAEAQHMEYRIADNLLELKGDARLWRGGDQFSGRHLIYDSAKRTVRAFGDKEQSDQGRVKVILQPAKEGADE